MSTPVESQSPWSVQANNKTVTDGFAIPPEENHEAALAAIVDLGTHSKEFDKTDAKGNKTGKKETRDYRQLFLAWELTDCENPDRQHNFVIGKEFSLSLGVRSALRPVVEIWKGRKLGDQESVNDIHLMLGARFMVEVQHQKSADGSRTYANVKAITSVPKKMTVAAPKLTPYLFALRGGDFQAFAPPPWLPQYSYGEKIADKMAESAEGRSFRGATQTGREADGAFGTAPTPWPGGPPGHRGAPLVPSGTLPVPPAPPPRGKKLAPAADQQRYFVIHASLNGGAKPALMTGAELQALIDALHISPTALEVAAEGTDEWKTADAFGFKDSVPY